MHRVHRRRGAALDEAILDAAWDVMVERGGHGLTFEAVAAAAGTSRPVLARRWSTRQDLVRAALRHRHAAEPIEVPDTGTLRADVLGLLRNAEAHRSWMLAVLAAGLTGFLADESSNLGALRADLAADREPDPLGVIVDRAVARGELDRRPTVARVLAVPFDLLRNELLLAGGPVDDQVLVSIVDDVWLPLLSAVTGAPRPGEEAA